MNFWIEENKIERVELRYTNSDYATEFLLDARANILAEDLSIDYWLVNFLYVDLIRIGKAEEASTLKVLKSIKEQANFHWTELRATASTKSIAELLKILPEHKDYGASIIAHRLIAEGQTDQLLKALEFQSLTYPAQKEILTLISRHDKDLRRVMDLYRKIKSSEAYDQSKFGVQHLIASQIKNGEINLQEAMETLNEFQMSREGYFGLATSCAESGKVDMYAEALQFLTDDYNRVWHLTNTSENVYFSLGDVAKEKFIALLEREKKTKGLKMHLSLHKDFLTEDFETSTALIDFCANHKKLQAEDVVFKFLVHNQRYKDCVKLIDETQGRNRFGHYEICLIELLNQGEYDFVLEKIVAIKDNGTRAGIIKRLLELNQFAKAEELNNKIFKSAKSKEQWTDQDFVIYYVRHNQKEKALAIIEKKKIATVRIGLYHQLGRMCLGLTYGSTG